MAKFIVVFSLIALIVVFNCATCIILHRLQSFLFFSSTKCYTMGIFFLLQNVILNMIYLINAKSINCNITCLKHNSSDHNLNLIK